MTLSKPAACIIITTFADARLEDRTAAALRSRANGAVCIKAAVADVLTAPRADTDVNTQFLFGDDVLVYDVMAGA